MMFLASRLIFAAFIIKASCQDDRSTVSICSADVPDVTPELGHPIYLSTEPVSTSQGCELTIHAPQSHRIQIVVKEGSSQLILKFCRLTHKAYLYILKLHSIGFHHDYLDDVAGCYWQDFYWGTRSNTAVQILFPELDTTGDYNLVLEVTVVESVMKKTTTTTTTAPTMTTAREAIPSLSTTTTDWSQNSLSMCTVGVHEVTPEVGHPIYLSVEPTSMTQGCDLTISVPKSHGVQMVVKQEDQRLALKLCRLSHMAYLYILKWYPHGMNDYYLTNVGGCYWQDFYWGTQSNTTVQIHFPEQTASDDYSLILEVTVVLKTIKPMTHVPSPSQNTTIENEILYSPGSDAVIDSLKSDAQRTTTSITIFAAFLSFLVLVYSSGAGIAF